MTSRTAATRYARALLDVASKEADPEKVERELDEFVAFLRQQPALDHVLMNPAVPTPRKRAAMADVVSLAKLSPVTGKLLVLLAERDRLPLLVDLATRYRELLMERQNIVSAEVTTAEPLSPDRTSAIEKQLATLTGKRVTITTKVDDSILGGMVARVGSTVYDGSIATQLKKIRERLAT
jgi:F-type H+-transporting ATPase subunit delta